MNEFALSPQPNEWLPLFAAACDGTLEEADSNVLRTLLRTNDDARREYVAFFDMHAALLWRYREGTKASTVVAPRSTIPRRTAMLAALAASMAAIIGLQLIKKPVAPQRQTFAAVVQISDGLLQSESETFQAGQSIGLGHCTLDAGVLELRIVNGVKLIVEGPAAFDLRSDMLVELSQGRVAAEVPVGAIGFTVVTPQGRIVDQGTEFGVAVHDGGTTDVEVFSGRVDISATKSDPAAAVVSLVEGEARRLVDGRIESAVAMEDRPSWTRSVFTQGDYRELGGPTPVVPIEPPPSVEPGQVADAERFFVICERQGVVLDHDLAATRASMKGRFTEVVYSTVVPAGTKVDVFLIHYDASSGNALARPIRHSLVRFRGRVLAAVAEPAQLAATDAWLGAPATRYPNRDQSSPLPSWFFRMQELEVANARLAGSFYFGGVGRAGDFAQVRVFVAATEY